MILTTNISKDVMYVFTYFRNRVV